MDAPVSELELLESELELQLDDPVKIRMNKDQNRQIQPSVTFGYCFWG